MMSCTIQHGLIMTIFLSSLLSGSLICTSLVTNNWIESKPWRIASPSESSGHINFGLLYGKKELNVAFGSRHSEIIISDLIKKDPEIMSPHLWYVTLLSTVMALFFTGLTIFLAIINFSMTISIKVFSTFGINYAIMIAFLLCVLSCFSWIIQFYTKLSKNILIQEDLNNSWTSKDVTTVGFSFWFIVTAGVLHIFNFCLMKLHSSGERTKDSVSYEVHDKSVGAIMLY